MTTTTVILMTSLAVMASRKFSVVQQQSGRLFQIPVDGLEDLLAGQLLGDPDAIEFVDLQVLDGDRGVPVDRLQGGPALAA